MEGDFWLALSSREEVQKLVIIHQGLITEDSSGFVIHMMKAGLKYTTKKINQPQPAIKQLIL